MEHITLTSDGTVIYDRGGKAPLYINSSAIASVECDGERPTERFWVSCAGHKHKLSGNAAEFCRLIGWRIPVPKVETPVTEEPIAEGGSPGSLETPAPPSEPEAAPQNQSTNNRRR